LRDSKQLLLDSRPFAKDNPWQSWWCVGSTAVILIAGLVLCAFDWDWRIRLPISILTSLVLVRMFVIYHDYEHGTILNHSRPARVLMTIFGLCTLNAPSIWARSHNHHHKNNSRLYGGFIGSFPTMTTEEYEQATLGQRVAYRIARHPLTIAAAYLTVFFYGMTIRPLFLNPRIHMDCAFALVIQIGFIAVATYFGGWPLAVYLVLIPVVISSAAGAYLFYAQHNFPGVKLRERAEWDHVYAALNSSSYIPMTPVMAWFTGNIGYHHIHHLNHKIPFYLLPKAMDEFEELQSPGCTTLYPWDMYRCLRLKLWDQENDELITFGQARGRRNRAKDQSPKKTQEHQEHQAASAANN
jgi:omega-6 fatty acid desaturase (delta-12 desaturase)